MDTYLFSTATLLLLLILIFPWSVNPFYSAERLLLYDTELPPLDAFFFSVGIKPTVKSQPKYNSNLGSSPGLSVHGMCECKQMQCHLA